MTLELEAVVEASPSSTRLPGHERSSQLRKEYQPCQVPQLLGDSMSHLIACSEFISAKTSWSGSYAL